MLVHVGRGDDEGEGLLCSLNAKTGSSVFILPMVQGELIWKNYSDSLATYILTGLGITWHASPESFHMKMETEPLEYFIEFSKSLK